MGLELSLSRVNHVGGVGGGRGPVSRGSGPFICMEGKGVARVVARRAAAPGDATTAPRGSTPPRRLPLKPA